MANPLTGARFPLLWLFFGLSGRISRSVYWLAQVALACVASAVIFQAMSQGAATFYTPALLLQPVVVIGVLYSTIALGWKRLHDFGWSGLYSLLLVAPVVISAIMLISGAAVLAPVASLLNLAVTIWFGLPPSEPGANRYGSGTNRPG